MLQPMRESAYKVLVKQVGNLRSNLLYVDFCTIVEYHNK